MTPLQKAAQQVIEQWDAPLWKNTISTAHFIGELRKALEAEQAQAGKTFAEVHPANPSATCKCEHWQSCAECHPTAHPAQAVEQEPVWFACDTAGSEFDITFVTTREEAAMAVENALADDPALTFDDLVTSLYAHPAPTPAADHIADAGKMVGGYSFAGKMIFERKQLIAALDGMYPSPAECHAARDMLEADAREIEATERQVEILSDELSKCSKAQKVAAQPYDQQAMELCDVCGWKAIMPGEPCLVCNMQAQQVAKPDHKPDWSAA